MSQQITLPGTDTIIGTYECGFGRTHQVPSNDVFVLKSGGCGFMGVCRCGLPDDATVADVTSKPHRLGPHWTLLGGKTLDPVFWLALEDTADGWESAEMPDSGTLGGDPSYRERREQYHAEMRTAIKDDDGGDG